MITGAGRHPQGAFQLRDGDPVHFVRIDDGIEQLRLRADRDGVGLHILGADVDRCAHGEAQALPLADGVPHSAAVGAYLSAADVEEIARRVVLAGEILHKAGVVAIRHEADVLTVVLAGVHKVLLLSDGAHFALVQTTQRQADMSQLLLREVVEHIALVFVLVQTLFEQPAARGLVLLHPGIMARDHMIQSVRFCPAKQVIELHISVAVDAGIGRTAGLVDPDEFVDDLFLKVCRKIQHLVGNIHRIGHLGGVLNVPLRAAGVQALGVHGLVAGEAHGDAGAVETVPLHEPCRHRAVHTAAHGDERPGAAGSVLCFCHSVPLPL